VATTYNNLYLEFRQILLAAGYKQAQLEARELVSYAAGKTREQFYRDMTLYASNEVEQRARELLKRHLAGEPVAYIIGEWEFYGLTLDISRDVLVPRPDTEVLAEKVIELVRAAGQGARVLDLCAGSGCIGLAVATHAPNCRAVLADLSENALHICRQNMRRNNLSGRVACILADALCVPNAGLGDFNVIACNPPYIRTGEIAELDGSVRNYEPHMALDGGADGLDFYRAVTEKWKEALRPGGTLAFEAGIGQAPDVELILGRGGFSNINTYQDTHGIWRVVTGVLNH
jgi:release factor glutamine methyltransferase